MANNFLYVDGKWHCGALMVLDILDRLPLGFVFPLSNCVGNYIKFLLF